MIDIPSDDVVFFPFEDLKPCPFCGGKAMMDTDKWYDEDGPIAYVKTYNIGCTSCGIKTTDYPNQITPYRLWQRRVGEAK